VLALGEWSSFSPLAQEGVKSLHFPQALTGLLPGSRAREQARKEPAVVVMMSLFTTRSLSSFWSVRDREGGEGGRTRFRARYPEPKICDETSLSTTRSKFSYLCKNSGVTTSILYCGWCCKHSPSLTPSRSCRDDCCAPSTTHRIRPSLRRAPQSGLTTDQSQPRVMPPIPYNAFWPWPFYVQAGCHNARGRDASAARRGQRARRDIAILQNELREHVKRLIARYRYRRLHKMVVTATAACVAPCVIGMIVKGFEPPATL
jgi:hypothetical protein